MAKTPKRIARAAIRDYGGRPLPRPGSQTYGTDFVFDDGYSVRLPDDTTHKAAERIVTALEKRYGPRGDHPSQPLVDRPDKPVLDLKRLHASDHAKLRLAQMKAQGGVTWDELLLCLRAPERVRYSEPHRAWVWIRGRLAVAVVQSGRHFIVTTILWSTAELFETHPRPENARHN